MVFIIIIQHNPNTEHHMVFIIKIWKLNNNKKLWIFYKECIPFRCCLILQSYSVTSQPVALTLLWPIGKIMRNVISQIHVLKEP